MKKITMLVISGAMFYTASLMAAGVSRGAEVSRASASSSVEGRRDEREHSDLNALNETTASAGWDQQGHWLEWTVDVPKAGDYQVVLRYAGGRPWPVYRELRIDGQLPAAEFAQLELPPTGGFGRETSHWRNLSLSSNTGEVLQLSLDKGPVTLRLTNLGSVGSDGAVKLDSIALLAADSDAALT